MAQTAPSETVNSWLQYKSLTCPLEEAVVTYDESLKRKSLTYSQLYKLASRFAALLRDEGVKKGDNVVIGLPNCLEQLVASLGIMLCGAVQIAVEVFLTTGDTFFEVLEKTKTRRLIVHKDESSLGYNLIKKYLCPSNRIAGCYFADVKTNAKIFSLEKVCILTRDGQGRGLLELLRNARDEYQCPDVTPDDLCTACSTACTSSMVRLVLHTHGSVVRSGISSGKGFPKGEKKLLYDYPTTWVTSAPCDFLMWGMTRVSLDHWQSFKVKDEHELMADVIEREKIEMTFLIPPHAESVASKWKPRPFPMIDHLWTGGMPMKEEMAKRLMPTAKRISVRYMSSEVPSLCYNSFCVADDFKDFDCGILDEGCQVRTTDQELRDLSPNKQGRLLLKAPGMFHSFLGESPEVTQSQFTADGWYMSNDGGYRREGDGHLLVMGRNDDMISHNVWILHPSWLEKDFKLHPDVNKVVVVPIPDEINIHNICACIVRKAGSEITAKEMKRHCQACYVSEEKESFGPSDVLFFDKLPEISPGQIDRKKATEIAVRVVSKAHSKGISTDHLETIILD